MTVGHGVVAPLHLAESEGFRVPLHGLVDILHRQGKNIVGKGISGFVEFRHLPVFLCCLLSLSATRTAAACDRIQGRADQHRTFEG